MARISIIAASFCKSATLRDYARARLAGHELAFADGRTLAGEELVGALADADAAVVGRELIDDAVLTQAPRLKALSLYGVGFDNIDVAACAARGVDFLVRHGVNAEAVAEHTIGLMLASLRNIAYTDRLLHQGQWLKDGGRQLSGSTVAVIGCGHVGSRVARLLTAFRCRLLLNDIRDVSALARETGGNSADFKQCLESADIVTVHVPLTARTAGLFDADTLARMRPGSVLVNTSRGAVVVLDALRNALKNGPLGGAALDVFEVEPLTDPRLYAEPRLVGTPHIAGNAREAVEAMGHAAVDMLLACLSRQQP
jgi:D-3-phosphoglycerate dehydrogenase